MSQWLRHWLAYRRFTKLPREQRELVFYSEGRSYWVHLEPLIRALVDDHRQSLCYVSSSEDDPGTAFEHPCVLPFVVGDGAVRTLLFSTLDAGVMVMSMPDLGKFWIRRSPRPVHYIYVHHSLVSTHMIYRQGAFDDFDTIMCAGRHHVEETRATEQAYGLAAKQLIEHGYGRLDALLAAKRGVDGARSARSARSASDTAPLRVLIAPSWGSKALLESVGAELLEVLLEARYHVTLRPHPQTRRLNPTLLDDMLERFGKRACFAYEEDVASQASLHASDLMISDWSGAALDYALALERPVLFVDVPRKVNNPQYQRLDPVPLEVSIREEIGAVVSPDALASVPGLVERLSSDAEAFGERIRAVRKRWVFNLGESGQRGAQAIMGILRSRRA